MLSPLPKKKRMVAPHLRGKKTDHSDKPAKLTKLDKVTLAPESDGGGIPLWAKLTMGAVGVLGVARGMAPQSSLVQPQEQELDTNFQIATDTTKTKKAEPKPEYSVSIDQTNDSMRKWMRGTLNGDDKVPGESGADDDGWTSELRFDITRTQGDEQWVLGGRHAMLTQQGAWLPTEDYSGLRTDLAEIALQKNWRTQLNDKLELTYGLGGGLQASGPLGGHGLQEWFHYNGGFGGRVGDDLQSNYSTSSIDFAPILTGGVGAKYDLTDNGKLFAKGTLQGTAALGPGFSTVRSQVGLLYQPTPKFSLEAGAKLDASYATSNAYDFYDTDGLRPGYYTQANLDLFKNVRAFGRIQDGGFRDEPVFTIGFTIGGGSRPWLDPIGR